MDYFDDLNPYLVKEDENENLTRQLTVPPNHPIQNAISEITFDDVFMILN